MLSTPQNKLPNAVLIGSIVSKIKHRMVEHGVDLKKILNEHDNEGKGWVNHIHFAFVMSETLYLGLDEIESLQRFLDDEGTGMLSIADLFGYMQSPERVRTRADQLIAKYRPKKSRPITKK